MRLRERKTTMLTFTTANISATNAAALVNSVNCVGSMRRGLALQYKKHYSESFITDEVACQHGVAAPGDEVVEAAANMAENIGGEENEHVDK
jgi:hypothetical protein